MHTMDAFWSGTDNANENATQFYGVWGKINDEKPKFLFRWVAGDKKVNIDPSVLFDIPQVKITTTVTREVPVEGFEPIVTSTEKYEAYQGPWENLEYPEDWMGQHSKKKYTPATPTRSWTGYQGGSQGGYQGNSYRSGQYQGTGYAGSGYAHGGSEDLPPSGHYDEYAGHSDYRSSSATSKSYQQPPAVTTQESWKDQKKNEVSGASGTKVEVFVDDPDLMPVEADALRTHIEFICDELILDGYDQIISSGLTDSSNFDHLHEDEQLR